MKRVSDYLREHILNNCGYYPPAVRMPPLEVLKVTEWSAEFEGHMRRRLIVGALRYGTQKQQARKQIDRIGSLRKRLNDYETTGNQEHLVDFAAIAMAEYIGPMHPNAHWTPSDDADFHGVISERKAG